MKWQIIPFIFLLACTEPVEVVGQVYSVSSQGQLMPLHCEKFNNDYDRARSLVKKLKRKTRLLIQWSQYSDQSLAALKVRELRQQIAGLSQEMTALFSGTDFGQNVEAEFRWLVHLPDGARVTSVTVDLEKSQLAPWAERIPTNLEMSPNGEVRFSFKANLPKVVLCWGVGLPLKLDAMSNLGPFKLTSEEGR